MENEIHHLENPSLYGETIPQAKRLPTIPEDGISTPRYEIPTEEHKLSQIMYGGLITPLPYNGTTDPRQWLMYYNDVADANLWTEDVKFKRLISCLEDAPLQWYRNEKIRNPSFNWTQFSRGLIEKYTNECDSFLSELNIMRRHQEKDEPFNSYWESKLSLIELTAPNMSTKEKITHLFNGLNKELANKVLTKYMTSKPESLEEMYRMIKRASDALNFTQARDTETNQTQGYNPRATDGQVRRTQNQNQAARRDPQIDRLIRSFDSLNQKLERLKFQENYRNNQDRSFRFTNPNQERRVRFDNISPPRFNQTRPNAENNGRSSEMRPPLNGFKRDISTIQCYFCNEFGHYANSCPKRSAPSKNEKQQN